MRLVKWLPIPGVNPRLFEISVHRAKPTWQKRGKKLLSSELWNRIDHLSVDLEANYLAKFGKMQNPVPVGFFIVNQCHVSAPCKANDLCAFILLRTFDMTTAKGKKRSRLSSLDAALVSPLLANPLAGFPTCRVYLPGQDSQTWQGIPLSFPWF